MLLNFVLEKTLEIPLDHKEIQPVHPKGNQSWIFIGRLMLKLKLQYFVHLMQKPDSLEKTHMLEDWRLRGEGDDRGCNGWMTSLIQWTWVWVSSRGWWWTWKRACYSPWGRQELDMTDRLNWNVFKNRKPVICGISINLLEGTCLEEN